MGGGREAEVESEMRRGNDVDGTSARESREKIEGEREMGRESQKERMREERTDSDAEPSTIPLFI